MKKIRFFAALALALCLVIGLGGCGGENLKANLLHGYDRFLQASSRYALTRESKLQGEKTKGEDPYVGSYVGDYEDFCGEEYLFGGTGLTREKGGGELTVTYTLKIESGAASLLWVHSGSEYTLSHTEGSGSTTVTLGSGDNYLVLKGEEFTGRLELEVTESGREPAASGTGGETP